MKFQERCDELSEVFDRFTAIPNQRVVAELQNYLDDARDSMKRLKSYVKYLGKNLFFICILFNVS